MAFGQVMFASNRLSFKKTPSLASRLNLAVSAVKAQLLPIRRILHDFKTLGELPPRPKQQWVEIALYGFVSRNYLDFCCGNVRPSQKSSLDDGTGVVSFSDGSVIVHRNSGHLVELDKRGRVTLVKVKQEEASAAKALLRKDDMSAAFRVKQTDEVNVICLPGNIVIEESSDCVSVRFPDGTDVVRKRTDVLTSGAAREMILSQGILGF